jgi:tripartite-type tricarboxylate transporter receptor subunit TctC
MRTLLMRVSTLFLMNVACAEVVHEPSIRECFLADGADPLGSTPDEFRTFAANEIGRWTKVVKASGIKVGF